MHGLKSWPHSPPAQYTHTKSDLELTKWPGDLCEHKVREPESSQLRASSSVAPSWSPGSFCRQHLCVSQNWYVGNVLLNVMFEYLLSPFLASLTSTNIIPGGASDSLLLRGQRSEAIVPASEQAQGQAQASHDSAMVRSRSL